MSKFDISDELLAKLAKLITDTGLTEIEFEEGERRLRLTKEPAQMVQAAVAPVVAPVTTPVAPMAARPQPLLVFQHPSP